MESRGRGRRRKHGFSVLLSHPHVPLLPLPGHVILGKLTCLDLLQAGGTGSSTVKDESICLSAVYLFISISTFLLVSVKMVGITI